MSFELWISFAALIAVATISPGPNVLIVVTSALRFGLVGAMLTILGNLIALFAIALLAAIGVGSLLKTAPVVFTIFKLAGAAYLIWMGFKMLRNAISPMQDIEVGTNEERTGFARHEPVIQAMLVSWSNPKSILFLSAVFPSFLDTGNALAPQFTIMFSTIIMLVASIHVFYALLALRARRKLATGKARQWMSRVSGLTFVGLGGGLAYDAVKSQ